MCKNMDGPESLMLSEVSQRMTNTAPSHLHMGLQKRIQQRKRKRKPQNRTLYYKEHTDGYQREGGSGRGERAKEINCIIMVMSPE